LLCDVIALLPEKEMSEWRFEDERHFPSRLLFSIGPQFDQSYILMFSLSQYPPCSSPIIGKLLHGVLIELLHAHPMPYTMHHKTLIPHFISRRVHT
jgi:hypothetical protein